MARPSFCLEASSFGIQLSSLASFCSGYDANSGDMCLCCDISRDKHISPELRLAGPELRLAGPGLGYRGGVLCHAGTAASGFAISRPRATRHRDLSPLHTTYRDDGCDE